MNLIIQGVWLYLTKKNESFDFRTLNSACWGKKEDGLTKEYYEDVTKNFQDSFSDRNPITIDYRMQDFGNTIQRLILVTKTQLFDQIEREKDFHQKIAKNLILKLQINFKFKNTEYKFFAIRGKGWRLYTSNGTLAAVSNDDVFILTTKGYKAEQSMNVGKTIEDLLVAGGVPKETAKAIGERAGGIKARAEEAVKGVMGSAKAAQMDAGGVVYDPGYPGKKGLTPRIQACLVRFAGGNDSGERSLKPYNLNTNAPGFSVWSTKFGDKGPVLRKKFDEYYDDKMLRVVLVLRDAINEYNIDKLKLDDPNTTTLERMLNQIKDSRGRYIIYEAILDSPACKDTLLIQEGKNPMVKDFEFLSNKNKKIHSMLMEQVKKIKEDK